MESHDTTRVICNSVDDGQNGTLTPDHTWANSVEGNTEPKVQDLGAGNVKHCCFGPPCKGHSKLKLIPRSGSKTKLIKPGLSWKHGKVFRQCLVILILIMMNNPECEYFCENVDFSYMPEDWHEVCSVPGALCVITADACSFTRRRRAHWTNIPLPDDWDSDWVPADPDTCTLFMERDVYTLSAHHGAVHQELL